MTDNNCLNKSKFITSHKEKASLIYLSEKYRYVCIDNIYY